MTNNIFADFLYDNLPKVMSVLCNYVLSIPDMLPMQSCQQFIHHLLFVDLVFFQHLFSKTVCTCTLSPSKSASPAYYSTTELLLWICLYNMYLDISEVQTILTACFYLLCLTFLTIYKNVLYYLLRSATLTVFVFCHLSKIISQSLWLCKYSLLKIIIMDDQVNTCPICERKTYLISLKHPTLYNISKYKQYKNKTKQKISFPFENWRKAFLSEPNSTK